MLSKIRGLFQSDFFTSENNDSKAHQLSEAQVRLACAALLIEVAVIHNGFDDSEMTALKDILHHQFSISEDEIDDMVDLAHKECSESTSMYQFTRLVNDHCGFDDKFNLIVNMWKIAYADGNLDKYEEYIIRKVADLIHVSHGDFIRAKISARSN